MTNKKLVKGFIFGAFLTTDGRLAGRYKEEKSDNIPDKVIKTSKVASIYNIGDKLYAKTTSGSVYQIIDGIDFL